MGFFWGGRGSGQEFKNTVCLVLLGCDSWYSTSRLVGKSDWSWNEEVGQLSWSTHRVTE